jgi:predicted N-acetyltransferase YhbS
MNPTRPKNMNLEIRTLTESDLDAADYLMRDAFRRPQSARAELASYLSLQPDGRLIALVDGAPVGMVGAIDYGPFAYIGTMAVLQTQQRRGIGYALMERLLTWLNARGCPMARLDASAAGQHLYPKLGFVTDEQTHVFKLQQSIASPRTPDRIRVAQADDLEAITNFDAPIFGARRADVFQRYYAWLNDRVFVVHNETGQLSGYLFAQTRSLGPWAAREPRDAEALLAAALSLAYETPPVARVPSSNLAAVELLQRNDFQLIESLAHMRRGGNPMPGNHTLLYSLASFAIG